MMPLSSSERSNALSLDGLSRRSIMPVMPPCLSASVMVSQPYWMSLDAYPASTPRSIMWSKHSTDPVWSMPHRIVCSPMRSDLTSATNDDSSTPARSPPVAAAYALACASPLPSGSLTGCTAMSVGTPNPRLYSSRTSVPGHFGATMMTVRSSLTCMPSSTMLKPCEYASVAPCFIIGMTSETTAVCCLSGVRFRTRSADGTSSSYVPVVKPLPCALTNDARFSSMATWRSAYDTSQPESRMFRPWLRPCAPQPMMTTFLPSMAAMPSSNSRRSMKRHRPSWFSLSAWLSVL
mmetsp:Transcript_16226/g.50199  ORF Transcript_16226/g.50199 Transcript_16226/m.50199 type:complete len:292 (+) Transcript_16226:705-1580(+)